MTTPATPVDTHAGRIAYAKASRTCFACRYYSRPFQTFSGDCRLGSPDWAYRNSTTVEWANTCAKFEEA